MVIEAGFDEKTGLRYNEYYLYSEKVWEMAPVGVSSFDLQHAVLQNAPVVVTPSGMETTTPTDPWAKTGGPEKYKKVGYGYFSSDNTSEFSLVPSSSGTLSFNGPLKENVFIEYEAGPSGYYIMRAIDYNPIRNEAESGFLHFSKTTAPASVYLAASRESMRADGHQGCLLTAIVYDEDFDRVPSIPVMFEVEELQPAGSGSLGWSELGEISPTDGTEYAFDASGICVKVLESTNNRGEAFCNYVTNLGKTGVVKIKAYHQSASGIYDEAGFYQFYLQSDPFTLDVSQLDTMDYLWT